MRENHATVFMRVYGVCAYVSVLSKLYHVTLGNNGLFFSRLVINLDKLGPVMTTVCLGDILYAKLQLKDQIL